MISLDSDLSSDVKSGRHKNSGAKTVNISLTPKLYSAFKQKLMQFFGVHIFSTTAILLLPYSKYYRTSGTKNVDLCEPELLTHLLCY